MIERLLALQRDGGRGVVLTVVEGDGLGTKLLVVEGGETLGDGPPELASPRGRADPRRAQPDARAGGPEGLRRGVRPAAPAAGLRRGRHRGIARAAANLLGWTTIVADARAKFATRERIPSADELIVAWPEETFAQVAPDHATAIVILTHDDKFDLPALELALASDAFYVGLIGGRRNQEKKRERLRELGVDETSIERIAGPCGLDIGADARPEVALSILAEAVAARNGRDGGSLSRSDAADPRRGTVVPRTRLSRGLRAGSAPRSPGGWQRTATAWCWRGT